MPERSSLRPRPLALPHRLLNPRAASAEANQAETGAAYRLAATGAPANPVLLPTKRRRLSRIPTWLLLLVSVQPASSLAGPLPVQPPPLRETRGTPEVPALPKPRRIMRRTVTIHLPPTPPAKLRPPPSHNAARSVLHLRRKMAASPLPRSLSRRQLKRSNMRSASARLVLSPVAVSRKLPWTLSILPAIRHGRKTLAHVRKHVV